MALVPPPASRKSTSKTDKPKTVEDIFLTPESDHTTASESDTVGWSIRVPKGLPRQMKLAAAQADRTIGDVCTEALSDWLRRHQGLGR